MPRVLRVRRSIRLSPWFSDRLKLNRSPLDSLSTTRGLVNTSNDCYINSCIQCLVHCEPFAQVMLFGGHCRSTKGFCSLCSMKRITSEILTENQKPTRAWGITANCRAINPEFLRGTQQDTHEFLSSLISRMTIEESYGCGTRNNNTSTCGSQNSGKLVEQIFKFTTKTIVRCSECGTKTETEETCNDLCLQIVNADKEEIRTVRDGLRYYFGTEELEGENAYMCGSCNERVKATKTVSLQEGPNVLVICLNRFSIEYDQILGQIVSKKLNHHVKFGRKLDVTPYMHEMSKKEELRLGDYQYRLSAFSHHIGPSTSQGHYVSNVFLPIGSDDREGKIWLEKNDAYVSETEFKKEANAYLLFYTREDWQPFELPGPKRKKESKRIGEAEKEANESADAENQYTQAEISLQEPTKEFSPSSSISVKEDAKVKKKQGKSNRKASPEARPVCDDNTAVETKEKKTKKKPSRPQKTTSDYNPKSSVNKGDRIERDPTQDLLVPARIRIRPPKKVIPEDAALRGCSSDDNTKIEKPKKKPVKKEPKQKRSAAVRRRGKQAKRLEPEEKGPKDQDAALSGIPSENNTKATKAKRKPEGKGPKDQDAALSGIPSENNTKATKAKRKPRKKAAVSRTTKKAQCKKKETTQTDEDILEAVKWEEIEEDGTLCEYELEDCSESE